MSPHSRKVLATGSFTVWAMRSAWAVAGTAVLTGASWVFRTLGIQ
jgi:hypothetical protein